VQQIGLPMRIALVAVLALAAVWFVALRPKSGGGSSTPAPPPTAPGVAGLTRSIDKARAATAAANASVAKVQSTAAATSNGTAGQPAAAPNGTGGQAAPSSASPAQPKAVVAAKPASSKTTVVTKTTPGGQSTTVVRHHSAPAKVVAVTPAASAKPKAVVVAKPNTAASPKPKAVVVAKPKPKAVPASPAAPLVAALNHHKVVVLAFVNGSSDSAAVVTAVRRLPRRHGKVVIRIASINQVGDYSVFTADTTITQAPSVLIIGSTDKARLIVGYTYTGELNQAVADVIAAKPATTKQP